jgi:hypothetical protein
MSCTKGLRSARLYRFEFSRRSSRFLGCIKACVLVRPGDRLIQAGTASLSCKCHRVGDIVKRLLRAHSKDFNRVLRVLGILVFVRLPSEAGSSKNGNQGVIYLRRISSTVRCPPCERAELIPGQAVEVSHIPFNSVRPQCSIGAGLRPYLGRSLGHY